MKGDNLFLIFFLFAYFSDLRKSNYRFSLGLFLLVLFLAYRPCNGLGLAYRP